MIARKKMKRASEAGMMLKGGTRKRRLEEVLAYLWKKVRGMVGENEKLDWSQAKKIWVSSGRF